MIDPDREPAKAREIGVEGINFILVEYGEAQTKVRKPTEKAITLGILRVLEGRKTRIRFLTGHGEPRLDAGGPAGLTRLGQALRESDYEIGSLNLLEEGHVPDDVDLVMLIHPSFPLGPEEVSALSEYLDGGGRLAIWFEPGDSTGLEETLRWHYVDLKPGVIMDEGPVTDRMGFGKWAPALAGNPSHEMTEGIYGMFVVSPRVRPLGLQEVRPFDLEALAVLKTAPTARVVASIALEDSVLAEGAQTAAVSVEWTGTGGEKWLREAASRDLPPRRPRARLLAVGTYALLTNRFMKVHSNRAFALDAVAWLTEQDYLLGLERGFQRPPRLQIGKGGLRALVYAVEFGMPAILAMIGLIVWLRREATRSEAV